MHSTAALTASLAGTMTVSPPGGAGWAPHPPPPAPPRPAAPPSAPHPAVAAPAAPRPAPPRPRRVQRIQQQVEEHLAQRALVGLHERQVVLHARVDRDILLPCDVAEQLQRAGQH